MSRQWEPCDELDRRVRMLEAERLRPVPRPPPAHSPARNTAILHAAELLAAALARIDDEEAGD